MQNSGKRLHPRHASYAYGRDGDKPWFGHHLISPITPLQGFEHYERFDESTNYSIFLEVTFLPRRVPNTGIRIVYPPVVRSTHKDVDIIFVHGLGGSARGTWTHPKTKWFWPENLPASLEFATARVSTFEYNANWQRLGSRNFLSISDFAAQLLEDLFQHYSHYGNVLHKCHGSI